MTNDARARVIFLMAGLNGDGLQLLHDRAEELATTHGRDLSADALASEQHARERAPDGPGDATWPRERARRAHEGVRALQEMAVTAGATEHEGSRAGLATTGEAREEWRVTGEAHVDGFGMLPIFEPVAIPVTVDPETAGERGPRRVAWDPKTEPFPAPRRPIDRPGPRPCDHVGQCNCPSLADL